MRPSSGGSGARFPFSAVVGLDDARLALVLAAVDPALGGVLLRGEKGSAKTTLARGLAALLPGEGRPFVDLPLGATEDRVVGSIDLAAALGGGEVRFRPGLLAGAHGGVLYVDEVNLLADHLVDVLLDVAVSGVNRVEREGIAHAHPARFVLVGSMNPEEGELRPQLLDRFGLAADVTAPTDPGVRAEAVARRLAFDADPTAFAAAWHDAERAQAAALAAARPAPVPPDLLRTVSALCVAVGAEGLRADLVICRAAAALAGLDGRPAATVDDVRRVAPLALAHRRRRQPFDDPGIDPEDLDRALDEARSETEEEAPEEETPEEGEPAPPSSGGERQASADGPTRVVRVEAPRAAPARTVDGRRSTVEGSRGRLVGDRVPGPAGPRAGVAVVATVRAAATRHALSSREDPRAERTTRSPGSGLGIGAEDLREPVREQRAANLVVLAVDASASMGAARRMEAAKGAVLSLLLDAYQRRDRVALVTFGGAEARVALRPTGSVEVARARMAELPTGGRTPLAAGLAAALEVVEGARRGAAAHQPLLVVVTDGRATHGPPGADPVAAAHEVAATVRRRRVPAVVVDAEDGPTRLGLATRLADVLGARYLTVPQLSAGALDGAIRAELRRPPSG